jgi:DNA polymerase I-like protein with 3'-5' exonuclease and polymerase domains
VVFGQGKASLSKKMGISEEIAAKLIHSLNRTFPVAFDWVKSQSTDGNNVATDALGRRRKFESHELYKIKNFCIQSPASMICLRKLVRLHEALSGMASICFHVHDGYCVLCKNSDLDLVREAGISALEEEDCLFEGLGLSTTCKFGPNLNELEEIILTKEIA